MKNDVYNGCTKSCLSNIQFMNPAKVCSEVVIIANIITYTSKDCQKMLQESLEKGYRRLGNFHVKNN